MAEAARVVEVAGITCTATKTTRLDFTDGDREDTSCGKVQVLVHVDPPPDLVAVEALVKKVGMMTAEVKARRVVVQCSLANNYMDATQPPPPDPDPLKTAGEIPVVELRAVTESHAVSRVVAEMAASEPHPTKNQKEVHMHGCATMVCTNAKERREAGKANVDPR